MVIISFFHLILYTVYRQKYLINISYKFIYYLYNRNEFFIYDSITSL